MQDPKYYTEKFYVLKVDKNNIRMSEFIRAKIGSFENGKAFYEFKQSEDLPCYKEVVYLPVSAFDCMQVIHKNVVQHHVILTVVHRNLQPSLKCQLAAALQVLIFFMKFLEYLVLKSSHHHRQSIKCLFKAHHRDLGV